MTDAPELKDICNLDVIAVPTQNVVTRLDLDDDISSSKK